MELDNFARHRSARGMKVCTPDLGASVLALLTQASAQFPERTRSCHRAFAQMVSFAGSVLLSRYSILPDSTEIESASAA